MSSALIVSMSGQPYGPVLDASTDSNKALPANIVTNSSRNAVRVVITCETQPIRYAFGGVIPNQSNTGHILAVNETLVLGHPAAIASFRFISATSGNHAALQITGEYAP